jgi:murein DD-endopeptidase MepM/ murein hydrolase activator NlpD
MHSRRTTLALVLALTALAASALAIDAAAGGAKSWRFPIRGDHDYGGQQGEFGVKRPDGTVHRGQDVLASCGTPLVAVHRARVLIRSHSAEMGNYMVLDSIGKPYDFVYAHMKSAGNPGKGKVVKAGRRIGSVGATGSSISVCHLHFEMWKGTWGKGRRVDPLSRLRRWDKHSKGEVIEMPKAKSRFLD